MLSCALPAPHNSSGTYTGTHCAFRQGQTAIHIPLVTCEKPMTLSISPRVHQVKSMGSQRGQHIAVRMIRSLEKDSSVQDSPERAV